MFSEEDWKKARGVECPSCHNECYRVVSGVCSTCYQERELKRMDKVEGKTVRRYYRRKLLEGTISLAQMREGLL